MEWLLYVIPVLVLVGLVGMFVLFFHYWNTDAARKKKAGNTHYNHPDKDMPLYNRGHCDRYSAGTFFWW